MDPLEPVQPEPCPTPLAWQEVVQSFREQGRSWLVDTGTAEVQVNEFGQGDPLVFLPPLAGDHWLFALTAWLLKDEFRCLILDHPGFKSPPGTRELIAATADVWSMAIEHACPEGAMLYAPNWGAQAALPILADRPQLVRGAILQGGWAHRSLTAAESALLRLGRLFPGPIRRAPLWTSAQIENHRRWFPPFDETRVGFLLNETGQTPTRDVCRRLLAAGVTDLRPLLPRISQPVRLLRCEGEGQAVSRAMDELAAGLPSCDFDEMYHTGHFPYLTHPHRLVKVIRAFVADRMTAPGIAT